MTIETIKMSSKGQIVIPQGIREELHLGEGTIFAVARSKNMIVLKKVPTPSPEEMVKTLKAMAKKGKKILQSKGFTEKDLRER